LRYCGVLHRLLPSTLTLIMLCPSRLLPPKSLALAVLSLLPRLTTGAAIRQMNVTSLAHSDAECTTSKDWLGYQLVAEDCNGAVNRLRNVEVSRHWLEQYEFLGIGAEPVTKFKTMQTPRRYTVRKSSRRFIVGMGRPWSLIMLWQAPVRSSLPCWMCLEKGICQTHRQDHFTIRMWRHFVSYL
jgi:hypothetical protein